MTFSIYLDDKVTKRLNRIAAESGKARNALIRQAIEEWLAKRQPRRWPGAILAFEGVRGAVRFEAHRKTLRTPVDPFKRISA